jgi:hypothetical protein
MRLQLLSDLHLETETFDATPAPGAEALVLGGDIDTTWAAFERFARWPVPVFLVAGNHEFDGREWNDAWPRLRAHVARFGIRLVERESVELTDRAGRRVRLLATTRWSDFDLFGPAQRERAMRSAAYFMRLMHATRDGVAFDSEAVRAEALACRRWLADELQRPHACDATLVVTHFGPSLRSADPRYGRQASTACFCNDDDALIPLADAWLHGHLHCCHDYRVARPQGGSTRVLSNPRGLQSKGEGARFDPWCMVDV